MSSVKHDDVIRVFSASAWRLKILNGKSNCMEIPLENLHQNKHLKIHKDPVGASFDSFQYFLGACFIQNNLTCLFLPIQLSVWLNDCTVFCSPYTKHYFVVQYNMYLSWTFYNLKVVNAIKKYREVLSAI